MSSGPSWATRLSDPEHHRWFCSLLNQPSHPKRVPTYICWAASATSVGTLVYHGAYEGDVALFDSSTGNDVTNGRTQVQTESTGSPAQLGVTMTRLGSYVVVTMGDMSVPSTGGQLDQSEYGRSSHLRQPGCWGSWPVLLRQSSSFGINERSTGDVVRVKAVG